VTSDVLDEAYVRLHQWGPEWGGDNGLSNHGPMAVEVLTRRGYDDRVGSWLDRYVARLETLPGDPRPRNNVEDPGYMELLVPPGVPDPPPRPNPPR